MVAMADYGVMYAIGAEGSLLVKIGMSRVSAQHRLEQMQNFSPMFLRIVAQTPVDAQICQVERAIHQLLQGYRAHGEWFAIEIDQKQLEALVLQAQDTLMQEALYDEQHPVLLTPEQIKRRETRAAQQAAAHEHVQASWARQRAQSSPERPPPLDALQPLHWLSLANHFRGQRALMNMTRGELAKRSGVKESTIGRIERRDYPDVGIETVMRLAVILGVTIEYRWKSHV